MPLGRSPGVPTTFIFTPSPPQSRQCAPLPLLHDTFKRLIMRMQERSLIMSSVPIALEIIWTLNSYKHWWVCTRSHIAEQTTSRTRILRRSNISLLLHARQCSPFQKVFVLFSQGVWCFAQEGAFNITVFLTAFKRQVPLIQNLSGLYLLKAQPYLRISPTLMSFERLIRKTAIENKILELEEILSNTRPGTSRHSKCLDSLAGWYRSQVLPYQKYRGYPKNPSNIGGYYLILMFFRVQGSTYLLRLVYHPQCGIQRYQRNPLPR
ncbi:hypothetical protein H4582DRAFT_1056527 [Lactarius indigo]|nr:hypothetical protein H4582DRAFT_1056527 [Lactarius indigo]